VWKTFNSKLWTSREPKGVLLLKTTINIDITFLAILKSQIKIGNHSHL